MKISVSSEALLILEIYNYADIGTETKLSLIIKK